MEYGQIVVIPERYSSYSQFPVCVSVPHLQMHLIFVLSNTCELY